MATRPRSTLYDWFGVTGRKPLWNQFRDWIDSFWHKDELIPITSIVGLQQILQNITNNNGGGGGLTPIVLTGINPTWAAPAATLIEKIVVIEPTAIAIKIGTTANGSDLLDLTQLQEGTSIIASDAYINNAATIYFTGSTSSTTIIIYRR